MARARCHGRQLNASAQEWPEYGAVFVGQGAYKSRLRPLGWAS